MRRDRQFDDRLWFGMLLGALAGFALGRRLAAPQQMPHRDRMQRALAEDRGPVLAAMLAGQAQAHYDALYASRPRFRNRALRFHLEGNILPGLALYRALQEAELDASHEALLAEMEAVYTAVFGRIRRLLPVSDRRPIPLALFRQITLWTLRLAFPPQGWEIEWVADGPPCVAFNVRRCFYVEVLAAYGALELTPLYCMMDDLLYESLPPSIRWERAKTLGWGDELCDFRWWWVEG